MKIEKCVKESFDQYRKKNKVLTDSLSGYKIGA